MANFSTSADQSMASFKSIGDAFGAPTRAPREYTASQTASVDDIGHVVVMTSASANNYTINQESASANPFPLYCVLVVMQGGAGATTIVSGTGVTINGADADVALAALGETAVLWQKSKDAWIAFNKTAA